MDILRRARQVGDGLRYGALPISIFPDYPPSVARARAVFTDVKRLLKGRADVRYGFMHPAKLRITFNGVKRDFLDPNQAMSYLKSDIMGERPTAND